MFHGSDFSFGYFSQLQPQLDVKPYDYDSVKKDLEEGIIPEVLREDWALVDEDSELGIYFQNYLTELTQKLLDDAGQNVDAEQLNLRFMLTNEAAPNAGIVMGAKPPIIMFTRGLWKKLKTRDQIEAVIAHELGHKEIFDKLGKHRNSKGEEISSDGYGVYLLNEAGRNVEAGKEVIDTIRDIPDINNAVSYKWGEYVDPHPTDDLRVRLFENAYEALREMQGGYTTASTLLNEAVKDKFSNFVFESNFNRLINQIGFHDFSLEQKINWIREVMPVANTWKYRLSSGSITIPGYNGRLREFEQILVDVTRAVGEKIKVSFSDKEANSYHTNLQTKLLTVVCEGAASYDFYDAVKRNCEYNIRYEPFEDYQQAIKYFFESTNPETTADAAKEIIEFINHRKIDPNHDAVLGSIGRKRYKLPSKQDVDLAEQKIVAEFSQRMKDTQDVDALYRELCAKHGIKMDWFEHVNHFLATNEPAIAKVIRLYGGKDPRLPKLPENPNAPLPPEKDSYGRKIERWTTKEDEAHPVLSIPNPTDYIRLDDRTVSRLKFSEEGYVISMQVRQPLLTIDENVDTKAEQMEILRLIDFVRAQKKALIEADFSELKNAFWGFVSRYREHLVPQVTLVNYAPSNPFQEKFIEELTHLISEDKAKYEPYAYEFFSGRRSKDQEPILSKNKDKRFTLPILLDAYSLLNGSNALDKKTYLGNLIIGVELGNPLMKFLLEDKFSLFGTEDKKPALSYGKWVKKDYEKGDSVKDVFEAEIYETFAPDSSSWSAIQPSLEKANKWFKTIKEANEKKEINQRELLFSAAEVESIPYVPALDIVLLEGATHEFTFNTKVILNCDDTALLYNVITFMGSQNYGERREKRLAAQMLTNSAFDLSDQVSAEELFKKYELYTQYYAFYENPDLRRAYQKRLIERSGEVTDKLALAHLAEAILSKHPPTSPSFENWLIKTWHDSYIKEFPHVMLWPSEFTDSIITRMPIARAQQMLALVAESYQLQREECYNIEQRLQEAGVAELPQSHFKAVLGEVLFDLVGQEPTVREQLIEYLSEAETAASTKNVVTIIDTAITRRNQKWDTTGTDLSVEQKEDLVRLMHENYCSWPIQWQAMYLEKIVFPVRDQLKNNGGKTITIENERIIVLDKAFPKTKSSSQIMRDFVESYLDQHTPAGQRLVLAIVMSSTREGRQDIGENISEMREAGRTVARILSKQHPLGTKFAQEIESYSGTDPEFRKGLSDVDVKAGVDMGTRWSTLHLLDKATRNKPSIVEGKHIGNVLGGGAVQKNVALGNEAISLLREDVNERANRQYDVFTGTLESFLKKHPNFSELSSILGSSYRNLKIETDYSLAPRQSANMQQIYKDGVIISDGIRVEFSAVDFKDYDEGFKLYSIANGIHFNDMPSCTKEEVEIKRAVAKAIIARELSAMMSGQAIDSDRHGKQQKIVIKHTKKGIVAYITNFDDGAVALNAPSKEEKNILGEAIGLALVSCLCEGKEISEAMVEVTKNYKGSEYADYIETSKRALRTMFGDYMNASYINREGKSETLISGNDLKDIVSAILKNGSIDKDILYPSARKLGYKALTEMHKGSVSEKLLEFFEKSKTIVQKILERGISGRTVKIKDPSKYKERLATTRNEPNKDLDWKDKLKEHAGQKGIELVGKAIGGFI